MHEAPVLADDGGNDPGATRPRYALFGDPIERSLSPRIHTLFAAQTGIAMHYSAISARPDTFAAQLAQFERDGGRGGNVTVPLKTLAAGLCRSLAPAAQRCGVVNTLIALSGGGFHGDNTDGAGLVADLTRRRQLDLRGRRTLLLGAGGAIAGIMPALLDAGVGEIVIASRRAEPAEQLVARIGLPRRIHTAYLNALADAGRFDLVINGTSAGHQGQALALPSRLVAPRAIVYDLNYGRSAIDFLAWGRADGAHDVLDGLGMLVDQAALAFALWHGVEADADAVHAQLAGSGHAAHTD
ncbi:MAG: shikimate dehydrogenase [Xanthomonadales bacterium]|nr:shikimate dehydrogenase [Xanthomonadales bacterium]